LEDDVVAEDAALSNQTLIYPPPCNRIDIT